ncbi:hypothetical protein SLA2020_165510 [Shorea laevis]
MTDDELLKQLEDMTKNALRHPLQTSSLNPLSPMRCNKLSPPVLFRPKCSSSLEDTMRVINRMQKGRVLLCPLSISI